MRPRSPLTQKIYQWVNNFNGWFSYFGIDSALGISSKKEKTLRRVTLKRLYDKGLLIRDPYHQGVYKRFLPAKKIEWFK